MGFTEPGKPYGAAMALGTLIAVLQKREDEREDVLGVHGEPVERAADRVHSSRRGADRGGEAHEDHAPPHDADRQP